MLSQQLEIWGCGLRGPKAQVSEHRREIIEEVSSKFLEGFIHECSGASLETDKTITRVLPV